MPASLYETRLAYHERELPWHGLGTSIPDGTTVEEGLEISQTNYPVMLGQPYGFITLDNEQNVLTPEMIKGDSVSNAIAVLRGPSYGDSEWAVLGRASTRFSILQNTDLAEIVEPLRKWGELETIGALDDGARFFISFRGDAFKVMINGKPDEHELYLVVKNTHLPGNALQFQLTKVRPVCRNTWNAGDQQALMNLPIAHTGDIKLVANWVVNALDSIPARVDKIRQSVEHMGTIPVSDIEFKKVAELVFPITKERKLTSALRDSTMINVPEALRMAAKNVDDLVERKDRELSVQNERMLSLQRAAYRTYQESDTVDRGNAYGAFNAFTETVDYVVRSSTATHQTKKAMASNFWGERAGMKIRAYETVLQPDLWKDK